MFAFIKGILITKTPTAVIIETGGIGYEILVPLLTYDKLPEIGKTVKLHVILNFTETEGLRLFGFYTSDEKFLFKQLVSVSKIGPKTALSILSVLSVNDLTQAILSSDVGLIKSVPGIGKKTAERLIIELKDKVVLQDDTVINLDKSSENRNIILEAESALITLGYKSSDIKRVLKNISSENNIQNVEELIKIAIKNLYSKRKK